MPNKSVLTNPYSPPQSDSLRERESRSFPLMPAVGLLVGTLFLGGVAYCIGYIVYLHLRYPGLSDPSANVDAYWPAVAEGVMYFFAGTAALIGVPTFWYSLVVFRRHRRSSTST